MAHFLGIDLRPTDWVQGVEHHGDTVVEGRSFIANCKVRALSEVELSNGLRLEDLRAQMQIFETFACSTNFRRCRTVSWALSDFMVAKTRTLNFRRRTPSSQVGLFSIRSRCRLRGTKYGKVATPTATLK